MSVHALRAAKVEALPPGHPSLPPARQLVTRHEPVRDRPVLSCPGLSPLAHDPVTTPSRDQEE